MRPNALAQQGQSNTGCWELSIFAFSMLGKRHGGEDGRETRKQIDA